MDEHEHDPRLTDARSENLGSDLPAKSVPLKSKVERSGKDLPSRDQLARSENSFLSLLGSIAKKDPPPSKEDWTLGPELSSDLFSTDIEDRSVEFDRISQSAPPQPGSKQPERASLSKSHSPRHATNTHLLDPRLMSITIWITDAVAHDVEIKQNATVSELKQRVQAKTGIQPDQMDLMYRGIPLGGLYGASSEEDYLSNYDIRNNFHLYVKHTGPESYSSGPKPEPDTRNHQAQHQAEATSTDYDDDLYIVDPQSYFDELSRLERDVVQRSEYFRSKREYSLSSAVDPVDDGGVFLNLLRLPASLQRKIRRSSIVAQVSFPFLLFHPTPCPESRSRI